ncbi:MAG TPA: formylglycine-generating enzyme family protein [Gemmatimonadaceae bacterium]|nr:formylglycine-generating enzyme family protein [Gemmatimonadaceae bacterium]
MSTRSDIAPSIEPKTGLTEMRHVPGGAFMMGSDRHYPEEAPAHKVKVASFWIDVHPVTNAEFKRFVDESGYVTLAERAANPADYPGAKTELLAPASVVFRKTRGRVDLRNPYNWWTYVPGAQWRHPRGPASSLDGLLDHPVVHVAFEDAGVFARWAGKQLPTEAEWEYAARGGLDGAEYCWGNEYRPEGRQMANSWQGEFPWQNTLDDGFEWTSPVGSFPPNGFGLHDMAGNVWEWTTDWYQEHGKIEKTCCTLDNPRGGKREDSADPRMTDVRIPRRVMKGGSFLCAPNYCHRYRPAARMAQPIDTSTCHVGFRCVARDVAPFGATSSMESESAARSLVGE